MNKHAKKKKGRKKKNVKQSRVRKLTTTKGGGRGYYKTQTFKEKKRIYEKDKGVARPKCLEKQGTGIFAPGIKGCPKKKKETGRSRPNEEDRIQKTASPPDREMGPF